MDLNKKSLNKRDDELTLVMKNYNNGLSLNKSDNDNVDVYNHKHKHNYKHKNKHIKYIEEKINLKCVYVESMSMPFILRTTPTSTNPLETTQP